MTTNDIENFGAQVRAVIEDWFVNSGFKARKLTDTPTDALQVANKKYVDGHSSSPSLCRIYLNTVSTFLGNSQIPFETVTFDTNSEFDITSHQFTAKTAGYYAAYVSAYMQSLTTNFQYAVKIFVNNAEVSESNHIRLNSSDDPFTLSIADIVHLNVGDKLDFYAYTNAGVAGTLSNGTTITFATIHSL